MKKEAVLSPMCESELMAQELELNLLGGLHEMQTGIALEEWEAVLEEELEEELEDELEEAPEEELDFLRSQQQGSWLDGYLDAIEAWEEEDE